MRPSASYKAPTGCANIWAFRLSRPVGAAREAWSRKPRASPWAIINRPLGAKSGGFHETRITRLRRRLSHPEKPHGRWCRLVAAVGLVRRAARHAIVRADLR